MKGWVDVGMEVWRYGQTDRWVDGWREERVMNR